MILFTRAVARDFKMLLSRCVSGRPRGPAPPLVIRFEAGRRIISATTPDGVRLSHTSSVGGNRDDRLVLPATVLTEVEGSTDEDVTLERQSKLRAVVRWHGGGKPRTLPIELILPGKQHELAEPPDLTSVAATIFAALQECGRSAARDNGRYALSRVQVQGRAGRVVGTDGKMALLWRGFTFPFQDDVLVPALSVFGSKPLSAARDVKVGRTATHLVLAAGPWSVGLPTDSTSRYPDVADIIPKHAPTVAGIDQRDAVEFLKVMATLPGHATENRPVTIDANATIRIRSRDPDTLETQEVTLIRSSVTGPPANVAIDRRVLARALSLGCHTFQFSSDKPLVGEGDDITVIVAPLDPTLIVPASDETQKIATRDASVPQQPTPTELRSLSMKPSETNGHHVSRDDPQDPLVAAEELRSALADAALKAAKLVAALKAGRKEKKVLATLYAGLKQLNLNAPNGQL